MTLDGLYAIGLWFLAAAAWALNLISLPGNWLVVALAAAYALWGPGDGGRTDLGWMAVAVCAALAIAGEVVEFAAAAAGTRRAGGTPRAAMFATGGSLVGAIAGMSLLAFIPIAGPVLGAILGSAVGAAAGAMIGQRQPGDALHAGAPVGLAAFWGRLAGTAGKLICGAGMLIALAVALWT
jgi:uncharacterized protein YqgC (DUF456 family)